MKELAKWAWILLICVAYYGWWTFVIFGIAFIFFFVKEQLWSK
jgi:hypothetical protein